MNSRKLIWTKRFSKDVKRAKRRNQNLVSLQKLIKMLQSGQDMRDVLNLSTYFFTQRKFNGLITRHGCGDSGIGKEIRKI